MRNAKEIIIKYRSVTGTLCALAIMIIAQPTALSITIGFFLIISGMFFRAWSAGYIIKNEQLATEGPYSLTRNPLYLGNFILGLGIGISSNTVEGLIIFASYYMLFFPFLITVEHKRLKKKFPSDYEKWAKSTNLFIPRIKKIKSPDFNLSFYMKNREYKVLYFSALTIIIFILEKLFLDKSILSLLLENFH